MATYSKGHRMISIEMKPLMGKTRPELFIGEGPNYLLKVASFGSVKKAELFDEWLRYFFGSMLVKDGEGGDAR